MFHLALTFGLDDEPLPALERVAGFVEETGRRHGVAEPLQMTVRAKAGERVYAARAGRTNEPKKKKKNDGFKILHTFNLWLNIRRHFILW